MTEQCCRERTCEGYHYGGQCCLCGAQLGEVLTWKFLDGMKIPNRIGAMHESAEIIELLSTNGGRHDVTVCCHAIDDGDVLRHGNALWHKMLRSWAGEIDGTAYTTADERRARPPMTEQQVAIQRRWFRKMVPVRPLMILGRERWIDKVSRESRDRQERMGR